MKPLLPARWAAPLAALAGAVMWLAFAPVALWPAAIVAVALLTAALWGARVRRGLVLGLLAGGCFFAPLLAWMQVVGIDAWLLLSVFCALWFALLGAGMAAVTRLPAAPVWIGGLWVLEEALRGRVPWGGFPWGDLSFSQPDSVLGPWAAYGGTPLVTFVIALLGAALVPATLGARARDWRRVGTWMAVVLAVLAGGVLLPISTVGDRIDGPPTAVVAVVQGGTPEFGLGALDVRRAVLDNHVRETKRLGQAIDAGQVPQPAFVLWPENSSDLDPFSDPTVAADITSAAQAVHAPILVGAVITAATDPRGIWNVGIVWDPVTGPQQMYIKTHPVPFGEYIPFRDFLAQHVGRFDRIPRDFFPGDRPGNLSIGGVEVGDVICFEVAYGEVVDAVVQGGARLLTVQTNNATYGGTPQPAQQLAITRMRALESGRTVAVASTSGISAMIAADGSVTSRLDEGASGWLVDEIPLRGELTLASRLGRPLELLLALVGLGSLVVVVAGTRRRRRRCIA